MTRTDDETPTQARDRDAVERGDGERGGEDGEEPGTNGGLNPDGGELLELAIVVASVLLIVATLGYVGWQAAVTTADGVPTATVEAIEPMPAPDDDRRQVTVRLDNQDGTGPDCPRYRWRSDVATRSGRSRSNTSLRAGGRRTGTVVCPAGTAPISEVVAWVRV